MSPMIDINFDVVPDQILPIDAGIYPLEISEVSQEPTAKGDSEKLVVTMKVSDPGNPNDGRTIKSHIGFKNPVMLKQLAMAAGLNPGSGGFDSSELIGKTVKAVIKPRTYRDQDSGEQKETSEVKEFIWK